MMPKTKNSFSLFGNDMVTNPSLFGYFQTIILGWLPFAIQAHRNQLEFGGIFERINTKRKTSRGFKNTKERCKIL